MIMSQASKSPTTPYATLSSHTEGITSLAFDRFATRLVSSSLDSTVRLWRVNPPMLKATLKGHGNYAEVTTVAVTEDGSMLASAGEKDIKLWNADRIYSSRPFPGENLLHRLTAHEDIVWSVGFDSMGKRLVSGSSDKTIRVWDTASGEAISKLSLQAVVKSVVFVGPNLIAATSGQAVEPAT